MENAKNSFYLSLRNSLAVVNAQRVMVVRGVTRPGILVEENESAAAVAAPDLFVLRWAATSVDLQHALPVAAMVCEIHSWTEGTSANGGLDRGRLLTAMDAELTQMLAGGNAGKQNFSVTPAVAMATRVFWSNPAFEAVVTVKNRLSRVARVTVYSYEEATEL